MYCTSMLSLYLRCAAGGERLSVQAEQGRGQSMHVWCPQLRGVANKGSVAARQATTKFSQPLKSPTHLYELRLSPLPRSRA